MVVVVVVASVVDRIAVAVDQIGVAVAFGIALERDSVFH